MRKNPPETLHPEMFWEVWRKWSELCAVFVGQGKELTKPIEQTLWTTAFRITDIRVRAEWETFRHKYGIGVYR